MSNMKFPTGQNLEGSVAIIFNTGEISPISDLVLVHMVMEEVIVIRTSCVSRTYIDRLNDLREDDHPFPLTPATVNQHRNSAKEDMQETMMTGLRLTREGISSTCFTNDSNWN